MTEVDTFETELEPVVFMCSKFRAGKTNSVLRERKEEHQGTSRPIRSHSGLYERSQLRTFRRSPRR